MWIDFAKQVTRMCYIKKVFLKTLQNLQGIDLCQSLFFDKILGLQLSNLLNKLLRREFCQDKKTERVTTGQIYCRNEK